jgi:alcohol dehydrogenase class IV
MNSFKVLTFLCPTKIYLGIHSHEKLKEIIAEQNIKRLLFLSDPGVASAEIYKRVEGILKAGEDRHFGPDCSQVVAL